MQLSKTVYFPDYPHSGIKKSGITIPFGSDDVDFYNYIKTLSSNNIRKLLGAANYCDLKDNADKNSVPLATFVREQIRKKTKGKIVSKNDNFFKIQSTFRGGRGSPLHEWYPYMEGYSPEFVSNIIETFAPEARDILDPFCGSGTTALVAAMRGGTGYYSEVNPVCRYVINAKALALTLSIKERHRISDELVSISKTVENNIKKSAKDVELSNSFSSAFGERPFFDAENYDSVLRSRKYADKIERQDAAIGQFFTVAVLRSLIPSSLLVRRGDLRFLTEKELTKGLPRFVDLLKESLELIASDLLDAEAAAGRTSFVGEDARSLSNNMDMTVDAVITSPPYLNGTNYFRNTKIELWFLRHITGKTDLRKYRDTAITSGINDVTRSRLHIARRSEVRFQSALLKKTLKKLNESAYDSRIPAMVENYFYDMADALADIPKVLNSGGIVAIDLGDSVYSGVHVPTHKILSEIMVSNGFIEENMVLLRERQSRGGTKLSQTLQVFKQKTPKQSQIPPKRKKNNKAWTTFKNELPHQSGEMARRNWGHSWHSMCSYQGKLKPAIASCLVEALMPKKSGRLLDTFSGVGTIPFEARLSGHEAFGFDISPAAVAISRAKLEGIDWVEVDKLLDILSIEIEEKWKQRRSLKALNEIRFNGPLPLYFHEKTFREILVAREFFLKNKPNTGSSAVVFASFLHILHGNRPYALSRRSHPITPFSPTGPTEYRSVMERLRNKVNRCRSNSENVPNVLGKSYFQDVTQSWPDEVDQLDAIITSPPFFDSTRFYTANWMRLWFSGWELNDFNKQPASFIDERQKTSFDIYDRIFQQANDRLKVGGVFAVHVGKSTKCDMAAELKRIGKQYLRFDDWFSESVEHCESHGIRDKGTVTHHQYLLFSKT